MEKTLEHLRSEGYQVDQFIPDGKIHRFPLDSTDKRNSAWYKGYTNYRLDTGELYYFVVYGDWRSNVTKKYCSLGTKLPASQARAHKQQMEAAKKAAEAEREADYVAAAREAAEFWETCALVGKSPYLERKHLPQNIDGIRFDGDHVYVPIRDAEDRLLSLEQISPDGRKLSWSGAKKAGGFFTFPALDHADKRCFVAEGFATAASIHLATSATTVCTFGTGNLKTVCQSLKKAWPDKTFIVCGDINKNERSDSQKLAENAAKAILCACVLPNLTAFSEPGLTDFNDLHVVAGLSEVARQLAQPTALAPIALTGLEIVETPFPDEDERGKRLATIENVKELMRRLGILARYNGISKKQEISIPGETFSMDNRDNCSLAHIMSWCERCRIPTSKLDAYLTAIADRNLYNPVSTWIQSSAWDGVSRMEEFYATVTAQNEELKKKLIRRWLISAVAAAYQPNGIAAGGMLVFQGLQYMGKSRWFKRLCPEELRRDGLELSPNEKDSVTRATEIWLGELGEIDQTFRKADIASLKAYITRDRDVLRVPFAKRNSEFARRTVYFGSVNELEYLQDKTGNRRFWTVECHDINPDHDVDMQQLFAEVLTFYRAGEQWWLSKEENEELAENNQRFEAIDPIEEKIHDYFGWGRDEADIVPSWMNATEVCHKIGLERASKADANSASRVIRKMGLQPDRKRRYRMPITKERALQEDNPAPVRSRF